jgi:hypothetical protein
MIRKTLFTTTHGCPDVPEFPHCLAQFDALGLSKVPTRTHHTRFTSLGWARVCGWGANDETTSTVEGESTVTEEIEHRRFSHSSPHT